MRVKVAMPSTGHRAAAIVLSAVVAAVVTVSALGASGAEACVAPSGGVLDRQFAARVLQLVNDHRAKVGLPRLRPAEPLRAAAEWKSLKMASTGRFAHDDPGLGVAQRLRTCGYPTNAGWGENIAMGYPSPAAVVDGWLASPGHRGNIETLAFRTTGIAAARSHDGTLYWTQDFGGAPARRTTGVAASGASRGSARKRPPEPPAQLEAVTVTQTSLQLRWKDASAGTGVTSYGIYTGNNRFAIVQRPRATVTGLVCGTKLSLGIDAADAAGNRSERSTISIRTAACAPTPDDRAPPSAPTGLAAVAGAARGELVLSWSPSHDEEGPVSYRVLNGDAIIASTSRLRASLAGLPCAYVVIGVEALDAAGNRSGRTTVRVRPSCEGG